ncbi:unnamed protein product [marine sediment metagenome]|uniref:TypA/BipA C-terminal domain-containing protein n=1 Tax=marine sediment metagenome TaxID=412755 RepID=X1USX5_9ZZZZ
MIFNSQVIDYQPIGKSIQRSRNGVLIASQGGDTLSYGLQSAQKRGITFVEPGVKVYKGMIVGKSAKDTDITVNVCKGKQLTNMRSKSSDGIIQLAPPTEITLEKGLDFIELDELMEITPQSIRLRKRILNKDERRRFQRNQSV